MDTKVKKFLLLHACLGIQGSYVLRYIDTKIWTPRRCVGLLGIQGYGHQSPKPSSLPRASAVCKRWDSILSDPDFLKLFRKHHRKPPLLGFFNGFANRFVPIMDSPDRIHAACFSQPKRSTPYKDYGEYMGCRHGLALLINKHERNTIVWDPLTGKQRTRPFNTRAR